MYRNILIIFLKNKLNREYFNNEVFLGYLHGSFRFDHDGAFTYPK